MVSNNFENTCVLQMLIQSPCLKTSSEVLNKENKLIFYIAFQNVGKSIPGENEGSGLKIVMPSFGSDFRISFITP